jgi:hypothetical protein
MKCAQTLRQKTGTPGTTAAITSKATLLIT